MFQVYIKLQIRSNPILIFHLLNLLISSWSKTCMKQRLSTENQNTKTDVVDVAECSLMGFKPRSTNKAVCVFCFIILNKHRKIWPATLLRGTRAVVCAKTAASSHPAWMRIILPSFLRFYSCVWTPSRRTTSSCSFVSAHLGRERGKLKIMFLLHLPVHVCA